MALPCVVLDISRRHIKRIEIVLASCNRGGCLVTSQIDRHEHCTVGVWVFSNLVLDVKCYSVQDFVREGMYAQLVSS